MWDIEREALKKYILINNLENFKNIWDDNFEASLGIFVTEVVSLRLCAVLVQREQHFCETLQS